MDETRRISKRTGQKTSKMCDFFLAEAQGPRALLDFSSRVPMFVGSAVFGVVGRPDLLRTGLRRATEGTAVISAQLTGITILAGVFFRKIEALLRFKYFSFNTWNDNKRQRASLTEAVSMVFKLRVSIIVRVSIQPLSKSAVTGPPVRPRPID